LFTSVSREAIDHVPDPVARIADLMASFPAPWALCGGWAVDAWQGRQTRQHDDVDISVFLHDQQALFEHLAGWQLLAHEPVFDVASPGNNGEWWDGRRRLQHPSHIHARPPELSGPLPEGGLAWPKDGFWLDIQLSERSRDDWIFSREPRVAMRLQRAVRQSDWGLPTLVPEALLFYKATGFIRRRDQLDFEGLLPHLARDQRDWLRKAVALVGHPWLARLCAEEQQRPAAPP
jgi:hypothetical protein